MTILVALMSTFSPQGTQAVVASDLRLRRQDGSYRDDVPKAFHFQSADGMRAMIGGITGQLYRGDEGRAAPMPQAGDPDTPLIKIIEAIFFQTRSLHEFEAACLRTLKREVPEQNGLDLIVIATPQLSLVGTPEARLISFANRQPAIGPRQTDGTAEALTSPLRGCGADYLDVAAHLRKSAGWSREDPLRIEMTCLPDELLRVADGAVDIAIAVSQRPGGDQGCGGAPRHVSMTFTRPRPDPIAA